VDDATQKAGVLIEALGWIRQFRDKHVVIKLGGSALENDETVRNLLTDVIFMGAVGMRPILVHGGGKAISQAMQDAGIEPRFVQGRRYTDQKTIELVSEVLAKEICGSLVGEMRKQAGHAMGLSFLSQNCLIGEKLTLTGEGGEEINLGRVGRIVDIDADLIRRTCEAGIIPVIPSIALDSAGDKLNVNADTAAAAVARLLNVEKLIFLSDVPGIFLDQHDPETLQNHLDVNRCRQLIADGTIATGMVPKVDAALEAIAAGVRKVHIVDGRKSHSLLLEIYSDHGIGTEIVPSASA